jgi:Ca-activated chloride channel family protein
VQLVGPETRRATTDINGSFTFDLVRTGSYQLHCERPGMLPVTQSATVQAGNITKLSIRMAVAPSVNQREASPPPPVARQDAARTGRGRTAREIASRRPWWGDDAATVRAQRRPVQHRGLRSPRREPVPSVSIDPLSTFSIDVDTASYANVRRFLNQGTLPPREPCASKS